MTSAANQQERLKTIGWIVGFVDGEGCFSISIFRNATMKLGWQIFPEFVVTQHEKSISALHLLHDFFACGKVTVNHRADNHTGDLYRYCVRSVNDLRTVIVPFFKDNPLRTSKAQDFDKFVQVLDLMQSNTHLTDDGLAAVAKIIETMNRNKPSRLLRILRDYTPDDPLSEG